MLIECCCRFFTHDNRPFLPTYQCSFAQRNQQSNDGVMIDPEPIVLPNMPIRDLIIDITVFDVKSIQFDRESRFYYEDKTLKYWAKLDSDMHIEYKLNRYKVDFL